MSRLGFVKNGVKVAFVPKQSNDLYEVIADGGDQGKSGTHCP
ncbi:hypothetical protein [Paraburkholderia caffeinilytica]